MSAIKIFQGTPDQVCDYVRQQALANVCRVWKFKGPAPHRRRNLLFR